MADAAGAEATLRLAGALTWFWFLHGHWSEGRTWLEAALTRGDAAPRESLPRAIHGATYFAMRQGDHARATELGERGLGLCRELGDKVNSIWLLTSLGVVAFQQQQIERAEKLWEAGIALSQELGDDWFLSMVRAQLGNLARSMREFERATSIHAQCLSLAKKTEDSFAIGYQLRNLAQASLESGQYDRAGDYFLEGLRKVRPLADRWITLECIDGLAALASIRGHHGTAAQLFGVGETLRALTGHFRPNTSRVHYDPYVAATRGALGEQEFSRLWNAGGAMPLDEGVDFALATTDVLVPAETVELRTRSSASRGGAPPRPTGATGAADASPLTPREREVAILVAQGLSNRDIATRLVVSVRTVETHIQNILNKIGGDSRTQIALWAVQRGLLDPPTA